MHSASGWLKKTRGSIRVGLGCVLAALILVPAFLWADAPAWWNEQGVLNTAPGVQADDYAAVNQGQVKNIATKAYQAMEAKGLVPANSPITTMVTAWGPPLPAGSTADDYAAINLGQLKNVAEPFYALLVDQLHYTGQPFAAGQSVGTGVRPWTGGTADDYALANIGRSRTCSLSKSPTRWWWSIPMTPMAMDYSILGS